MASHDPYGREYSRHYVREERREPARDRYLDPRDHPNTYSRDLVRRQETDISVDEYNGQLAPPSSRDVRRARSVGPFDDDYRHSRGYADYEHYDAPYPRDRNRDRGRPSDYEYEYERRHHRGTSTSSYHDDDRRAKARARAKQDKIIAAVAGAALLVGGKELYDRHEAKEGRTDVHRNPLSSAALAGFGALAAYQGVEFYSKQQARKDQKANYILLRGRDGQMSEYYSDDDGDDREKRGNKSFLESALAATGLGTAVKHLTSGGDDRHSDRHSRRGSPTSSRAVSQERGGGANKIQKAAMASLLAGATEAFRVAKEPGGWKGEKAKRVLTAAAGAATVDASQIGDRGKLGLAESVIGGLIGNRLINGSKREIEEDEKTGHSRSRSRAPSRTGGNHGGANLAALATAGLGAFGAKKILDRPRSHSRSRRADSYDSRDESPDRRRQRSRSRSVVDRARNSLAKLGFGTPDAGAVDNRRRDQDDYSESHRTRSRRYSDEYDNRGDRDYARSSRGGHGPSQSRSRRHADHSDYGSDTDLGDSDEDERRAKKLRGKQILTSSLAGVATIHAAHEVFESLEKRKARKEAVKDGRLSQVDAQKLKTKAIIKDVSSVALAAFGIKGALENVKEARHMQHECKHFQLEKARRHERREQRRKRQDLGPRRRSGSLPVPRRQGMIDWDGDVPRYDDGHYTTRPAVPAWRHQEV